MPSPRMRQILIVFLTITLCSCVSSRSPGTGAIQAQLILPDSTVTRGNPFEVEIHLRNISEYAVQIPEEIHFTSDLHPNGLDRDLTGLGIHFDIEPEPEAFVLIEPPSIGLVDHYERLLAGKTRVIEYDLRRHLLCEPGQPATGVSNCPGDWLLPPGQYKLSAEVIYTGGGLATPLPCEAWRGWDSTEQVPFELR